MMFEAWTRMMMNPLETMLKVSNDQKRLFENCIKYQNAMVEYHKALREMTEAVNDNLEILKNMSK